jgi:tRNA1(Val) A37 N6-methylase TrmN6
MPRGYKSAQETLDGVLNHTIVVRQRQSGHRAGTDTILLAMASVGLLRVGRIVDLGAGVGTVGLIISKKMPQAEVCLVENDPLLACMARDNIVRNQLACRTCVIEADIRAPSSERRCLGLVSEMADMVVSNPPFLCVPEAEHVSKNYQEHVISERDFDRWFRVAADLLKPSGLMVCIYRADGFSRLLPALEKRFGRLIIRPVHAYATDPAIRFLVMGQKGSRGSLQFLPPLILHQPCGRFTAESEALHRGELSSCLFRPAL